MITEYAIKDISTILNVINDAAIKYKGIIPEDCWHEPYMLEQELINEFNNGVRVFGYKKNNKNVEIIYVEVPTGGVVFHHGYTWHGSGINNSQENRRVIVSHCIPHDAKFHPTNNGGTGKIYKRYKKNNTDELDDSFLPLLWKEK